MEASVGYEHIIHKHKFEERLTIEISGAHRVLAQVVANPIFDPELGIHTNVLNDSLSGTL